MQAALRRQRCTPVGTAVAAAHVLQRAVRVAQARLVLGRLREQALSLALQERARMEEAARRAEGPEVEAEAEADGETEAEAEAPIHISSQKLFSAPGSPADGAASVGALLLHSPLDASAPAGGGAAMDGRVDAPTHSHVTPVASGGVVPVLQLGSSAAKARRLSGGVVGSARERPRQGAVQALFLKSALFRQSV